MLPEDAVEEGLVVGYVVDDKKSRSFRPSFGITSRRRLLVWHLPPPWPILAAFMPLSIVMGTFSLLLNLSSPVKTNVMVQVRGENLNKGVTRLELTNSPERFIIDRKNHHWIDHGTSWHPQHHYSDDIDDGCIPLGDWQDERNIITCNLFHEINLESESLHHIGAGSFRDAWSFVEYDGTEKVLPCKQGQS
jgi:hypothetical protein